ncbi:unnamed protein product [Amoebophrya sp. A25]|nr:unnamed protein product [Amoebophrya sp. A25]|eukprot:GSA25T00010744001.1
MADPNQHAPGIHAVETVSSVATLGPVVRDVATVEHHAVPVQEHVLGSRYKEGDALHPGEIIGVRRADGGGDSALQASREEQERQDLLLKIHGQDSRIVELRAKCKAERDRKLKILDDLRNRMLKLEGIVLASRLIPTNEGPPLAANARPVASQQTELVMERVATVPQLATTRLPAGATSDSQTSAKLAASKTGSNVQSGLKRSDFFARPLGPKQYNPGLESTQGHKSMGAMSNDFTRIPDPHGTGDVYMLTPRGPP